MQDNQNLEIANMEQMVTDATYLMLNEKKGVTYTIKYLESEGLDKESADQIVTKINSDFREKQEKKGSVLMMIAIVLVFVNIIIGSRFLGTSALLIGWFFFLGLRAMNKKLPS